MSDNQASIQISNTGLVKAPAIDLEVTLARHATAVDVEAMTLGVDLPRMSTSDGKKWAMQLDELGPGKNLAYKIAFKNDLL